MSGFQRPPADGLDLEELRQALQNDLDPSEHGNRVRVNSSGHSTPSQGSHTMGSGSGLSSQSSSGAASPYPDRKTSWPVSGPRSHNPPYPMNRSVSSPERKYSAERESPLSRRRELDPTVLSSIYQALETHLQPIAPNPSIPESQAIYDEHIKLAKDYIQVQTEMAMILQKKLELERQLQQYETEQQVNAQYVEEFAMLTSEKENLLLLHKNLKSELENMKRHTGVLQSQPSRPLSQFR